jgi:hypothetical protein
MRAVYAQLDARTINERLTDRRVPLVQLLLPNGHYASGGRSWRAGTLGDDEGSALCVRLDGTQCGRWKDYKSGAGGDLLDLVAAVLFHGNLREALKWALGWLGLGQVDAREAERLKQAAETARDKRRLQAEREALHNAQDAKRIYLAGAPLTPGDPGWCYLAEHRLIDLSALPVPLRGLRVHAALYNRESRREWPALLAPISAPDGRHINTHCIFLAKLRDGSFGKAPLDRPKLSMAGGYTGGCVRLWRGASGKAWAGMPDNETVLAGEGIEDVMTITCARPEWRSIAVLSVSSLAGLVLPPQVTRLIWVAQNDPPGSPAANTLARALREHSARGLAIATIRPPPCAKDVNEFAQQLAEQDDAGTS